MKSLTQSVSASYWEIPFQLVLLVLVFMFYAFDRQDPQIEITDVVFFLNYAVAVMIVNYVLFPKYLYQNKFGLFFLFFAIVTVSVILIEEFVLEQIFYPDTRGQNFQGFMYGLVDVLPVITILSGFKLAWDIIRKQREVEELQASIEASELSFLRTQINPHFLFNNLNNLYSYALENSPNTPKIILELSSVLRYMLYESSEKYVPLRKELDQLESYIQLNTLQIEERGEITFNHPQNVGGALQIAPLILMVFVENAFKHSMASLPDGIVISISVEITPEGLLKFHCRNNYKEIANNDSLSSGIGLANVRKRLKYLYPEAHALTIKDEGEWYNVELEIDLN